MAHDVFICHAHADLNTALAACAKLEEANIRCWIAPRNVGAGAYARQLVQAIAEASAVLLIFSDQTNASEHVLRELEIASNRQKVIIPFRIEDVRPNEDVEYFTLRVHWLDALTPPMESRLAELVSFVQRLLAAQPILTAPDLTGSVEDVERHGVEALEQGTRAARLERPEETAEVLLDNQDQARVEREPGQSQERLKPSLAAIFISGIVSGTVGGLLLFAYLVVVSMTVGRNPLDRAASEVASTFTDWLQVFFNFYPHYYTVYYVIFFVVCITCALLYGFLFRTNPVLERSSLVAGICVGLVFVSPRIIFNGNLLMYINPDTANMQPRLIEAMVVFGYVAFYGIPVALVSSRILRRARPALSQSLP